MPGKKPERIPAALQQVFAASNAGEEVHHPPSDGVASKVYLRNWVHQNKSGSLSSHSKSTRSLFGDSQGKIKSFKNNVPETSRTAGQKSRRLSFRKFSKNELQKLLDETMKARGYPVDTYNTLQTAYYSPATPLQTASYGPAIIRIVKDGDAEQVRDVLKAGLHPNTCNSHSESLLHMACRRGYIDLVKVFLEFGANLQVSDDYGRTPMHDACWQNEMNFDVVEQILKVDNRLLYMLDCRGSLPLSYVHKDHFEVWHEFLTNEEMLDKYFPKQAPSDEAPELCKLWPNARPLQDPKGALSPELAQMVANGKVNPADALVLAEDMSTVAEESDSEDSYDSDYDSSDDEDDDDECEADEEIIQLALSASDLKF